MIRFCLGNIKPAGEFLHAHAQIAGNYTVELLAQVRGTGRILDAQRLVLGGSEILSVDFNVGDVVPSDRIRDWRFKFQIWPRDILLRRNMVSSSWLDVVTIAAGRDAEIFDQHGAQIPQNEFLEILGGGENPVGGAVRWAVTIGDDGLLQLVLQGLPGNAQILNAKPALRK